MKNYSKGIAIGKMLLFGVLAVLVFTLAVMLLWNRLMPLIFGLTTITFWQALGLLVLSKILFGKGQRTNRLDRGTSKMHKEQFMKQFGMARSNDDVKPKNEISDEEK